MHDVFKRCRKAASCVIVLLLRSVAETSLAQGESRGFSEVTMPEIAIKSHILNIAFIIWSPWNSTASQ